MAEANIFKATMIVKAELLSEGGTMIIITLPEGSKIVGRSLGIETEEDDAGFDYEVLAFQCPDLDKVFWLKNEQIKDVQVALGRAT